MSGASVSNMDRATLGLRRHVLRQLTHWEGAAERLDDFEATAALRNLNRAIATVGWTNPYDWRVRWKQGRKP